MRTHANSYRTPSACAVPRVSLVRLTSLAVCVVGCGGSNSAGTIERGAGGNAGATQTGGASAANTQSGGTGTGGAASAAGGNAIIGGTTARDTSAGTGGAPKPIGGNTGAGGTTKASTSSGGAQTSTGGSFSTGGTKASGGAASTGGTKVGAGGSTPGAGGSKASGGSASSGGSKAAVGGSSLIAAGGTGVGGTSPATGPGSLYNGIQWADTSGNPIQAHGGGVIEVDGFYYWFGENRNPNGTFYAVSCYRSADLVHWEFRNNVLTQSSDPELKPANVERPKVIYNANTKKYVMWMHWENGSDYSASRAGVASCDTVDGNYTYHGAARPLVDSGVVDHSTPGYQSRDCTAFVDTDGKGYFLSAANENYDLNLYLLKGDYLSIDTLAATLFKGGHREAPALFKRNDRYFLITSAATGWDPNQAQYATSTSLTSGWGSLTNVADSTTFHSQSTFVVPVEGSAGTAYLYMGDRWAGSWGGPVNDSTYVWIPISFSSSTAMSMSWANTLTIDAAAGTISAATNQFKYVNKSSGFAMSVDGASTADGADVIQANDGSGKEQRWTINYDSNGYFNITNVNSSKVLDVTSSATTDGASIIQYTSNDGDNQKWRIVDKGAGYYQLLNKNSNKVAEVPANSVSGAALVQRAASSSSANQLWQMAVAQ